jgi:hypothetical protein
LSNRFATTQWNVVLAARNGSESQARAALELLCDAYWFPLYAYVRRRGHAADEARDLTQEFFADLLSRDFLAAIDQSKGRFRSFLLASLEHLLSGTAVVHDLQEQRSWELTSHGTEITNVAWHPSGRQVITASLDGIVRVGEMTGEEPHLLMGHEAGVTNLLVEPGGRWIASSGLDGTVRQWPMPEGQPFHTLPRVELLARLRALTNYRVVEDGASPSGYRMDVEPFTGWKREPARW